MNTIALTGTAGFLGSSLLRELENDPRYPSLIALDTRKPPFELKKARFYRMDLTETLADSTLIEILEDKNVETLIHTAFPVSPPHDLEWAHELISVGTMYVLDGCARLNVKKLIMTSTTEVYGAHPANPNYLSEESPRRGGQKSRFLRDKIEAEDQFLRYAANHPQTCVTILRPCTILGPTVRHYKTTFLQRPVLMKPMGYDPLFQFVHEQDVLRALRLVIEKEVPGVYNIIGQGVMPLSMILKQAGKVPFSVPSPFLYPFVQGMWMAGVFNAPASRLDFLKYLSVADGQKAEKIGYHPRYSTQQALQSFLESQGGMRG